MIKEVAKKAKFAALKMRKSTATQRQKALLEIEKHLLENTHAIEQANAMDLEMAKKLKLSAALIDRLVLDTPKVLDLAQVVQNIAHQKEVVGEIESSWKRDDGLVVKKQKIPLGVILMIFESRPNVVVDCASLAIKSANAILLKGGKEALHTNRILGDIIKRAVESLLGRDVVQVLPSDQRQLIDELLTLNEYIDLVIPRGGEKLIDYVYKNSKIPVVAHFKGLCHLYVHDDADLEWAQAICLNAKVQRPGVCNAMETLILNQGLPDKFIQSLVDSLKSAHVDLVGDKYLVDLCGEDKVAKASAADWDTEYLDKKLAIKSCRNIDEAIAHIEQHGTHHTEGIVATSDQVIEKFCREVDASCVVVNASTRFNDGEQLGLGAELGISTGKFHAYGPMGVGEITATRYLVTGQGHLRT